MQRILANWVPPERKATALSIVISGFQLGTVGAYLVSPWVLDVMSGADGGPVGMGGASGWRGMFYVYGALVLGWMVPWWFVAKDAPSKSSTSKDDDGDLIDNCEETS
jgi:ACS family sodium-dependent inorganic phosphate cotransporter